MHSITRAKRVRESARARWAPVSHQSHARIVCASVGAWSAFTGKKTIFRKTQSSRAEKDTGKRECARWIRARSLLCDRRK